MKQRLDQLQAVVKQCGEYAKAMQANVHRDYKSDGSVLTEVDLEISRRLIEAIRTLFPQANILTEEVDLGAFNPDAEYTFIFDPIDGTDPYSQGFPMWCIGIGILDRNRVPVGSMVYAPRFGRVSDEMLLRTDPGDDRILLNGEPLDLSAFTDGSKDVPHQITTGSSVMKDLSLEKANVHFRSFGTGILHISSILLFSDIDGCLDPRCHLWDIAPVHALVLKAGMDFQYCDGEKFEYTDELYFGRRKFRTTLLVGTPKWRQEMRRRLAQ